MRRILLAIGLLLCSASAHAAPLKVVASFSILGDLVKQVGGDDVAVTTLVGPNGDTHEYEPKPSDAKAIADADVLVVNGLGLEGWMDRLKAASGYKGPVVVATSLMPGNQIAPMGDEAKIDPHAWQSVPNAILYVRAIETGLEKADPTHATGYNARADAYRKQLTQLDSDLRAAFAPIPQEKRIVITTHDAFGYYGNAYGIRFLAPQGISTDSEASPQAVASLIRQIKAQHIHAVFIENMTDGRLVRQIAAETGVDVTGQLFSDALSPPSGPAATYIEMVRYNTAMLVKALNEP